MFLAESHHQPSTQGYEASFPHPNSPNHQSEGPAFARQCSAFCLVIDVLICGIWYMVYGMWYMAGTSIAKLDDVRYLLVFWIAVGASRLSHPCKKKVERGGNA